MSGRLLDAERGEPLAGRVRFEPAGEPGGPQTAAVEVGAGPDGRFALRVPAALGGVLLLEAEGHLARRVPVAAGEGPLRLGALRLRPSGEVRGRVRDRHGEPVHGARVRVLLAPGGEAVGEGRTDAAGRFALRTPAGDRWLQAEHPAAGRCEPVAVRVLRGQVREGVELRLPGRADRPAPAP